MICYIYITAFILPGDSTVTASTKQSNTCEIEGLLCYVHIASFPGSPHFKQIKMEAREEPVMFTHVLYNYAMNRLNDSIDMCTAP